MSVLRVFVVNLLTDVFLSVPLLLIALVGLATSYGMAFAYVGFNPRDISTWTAGGPVLVGAGVVMAVGVVAMLWLSARVALGPAATIAEGRVQMLSTWPLTRGRGVAIMVGRFLLSLPILLLLIAALVAVNRAPPTAWYARAIPLIATLLIVGVRMPLKVGLMVFFYERRAPLPPVIAP